jgi:hypothetical protein
MPKGTGSSKQTADTKPSNTQAADSTGHATDAATEHATSRPTAVHRSHARWSWFIAEMLQGPADPIVQ